MKFGQALVAQLVLYQVTSLFCENVVSKTTFTARLFLEKHSGSGQPNKLHEC